MRPRGSASHSHFLSRRWHSSSRRRVPTRSATSRSITTAGCAFPTDVLIDHVTDFAEIPTFTEKHSMDTDADGNVSDSESRHLCAERVHHVGEFARPATVTRG